MVSPNICEYQASVNLTSTVIKVHDFLLEIVLSNCDSSLFLGDREYSVTGRQDAGMTLHVSSQCFAPNGML